jgi:hypothetical protein
MTADEQRAIWREKTRLWRQRNPEKNREVAQRAMAKYLAAEKERHPRQGPAKPSPTPEERREAMRAWRESLTPETRARYSARLREQRASLPAEDRAAARRVRYEARREQEAAAARRYRETHLEEMRVVRTAWRKANPEKRRTAKRRARYGLAVGQYEAMFEAQEGVCAICGKPETQVDKVSGVLCGLGVDHDHACCPGDRACGKCVRGLLCMACNHGLGRFGDDPALLTAAINYLLKGAA